MTRFASSLADGLLTWPRRRPWATLVAAAVVCLLAVPMVLRIAFDSSLELLLPTGDPAVAATLRTLHDFEFADDLLLMVSLDAKATSGASPLTEYAARLEQVIRDDAELASMVESVRYRGGEGVRQFFEEIVVPHGVVYLDDAQFAALRQRLTPQGMREQLQRTQVMLTSPSPVAAGLGRALAKDPLRLQELLREAFDDVPQASQAWRSTGAMLSDDGRSLLIRVAGVRPPTDLAFTRRFLVGIQRAIAQAEAGDLDVQLSGSYAIADLSHRVIRSDMIQSVIGSVVALQLLFLCVYRRWWSFVLAFAPIGAGILVGFGVFGVLRARMTPVGAAIGSILAGMAIDYSIHYLFHYHASRDCRETSRLRGGFGIDLLGACVTSLAAFAAIGASRVPALRDFALLGGLGLAAALVATLTILPAVLALVEQRSTHTFGGLGPRWHSATLVTWIARRRRVALSCGVGLMLAAGAVLALQWPDGGFFEHDSDSMHPRPNPPLATQRRIAARFSGAAGTLVIHVDAEDSEQLLVRSHEVRHRMRQAKLDRVVAGTFGLASLLPSPAHASQRLQDVQAIDADAVVAGFRAALQDTDMAPEAFDAYAQGLRKWLRPEGSPDLADLLVQRDAARTILPHATEAMPTQALTLVMLRPGDRAAATDAVVAALADVPGATVTGLSMVGRTVERTVRRELPRLMLLAAVLVAVILVVQFRSVTAAALAAMPTAVGVMFLLATMLVRGERFGLVNLVALPLIAGIGVDYGIFVVGACRRAKGDAAIEAIGAPTHAIILCAATTVLGFGSLVFTHVPAIQSLGAAMASSIVGCCVGTFLILVPLQLLRMRERS